MMRKRLKPNQPQLFHPSAPPRTFTVRSRPLWTLSQDLGLVCFLCGSDLRSETIHLAETDGRRCFPAAKVTEISEHGTSHHSLIFSRQTVIAHTGSNHTKIKRLLQLHKPFEVLSRCVQSLGEVGDHCCGKHQA